MALSARQIEEHCQRLLQPVTRYIDKELGTEASDLTGICLHRALLKYEDDGDGIVDDGWVFRKTKLLVIDSLRSPEEGGRKGTERHRVLTEGRVSLAEDFDKPIEHDISAATNNHEQLHASLKIIEGQRQLSKWLLIGRFLGGFENSDMQRILNVSERTIQRAESVLRELVPAH